MNLYKTTGSFNEDTFVKWDGTQADAGKTRKEFKEKGRDDVKTDDVNVPTDKAGLLEFLNKNEVGK